MMDFAHSYIFWYVVFYTHLVIVVVNFLNGLHTSALDGKNFT